MAIETLHKLCERVHNVFAQGLQMTAPDEFNVLIQELSALKLEQPAALLKQIQQNLVNRMVAQKDVEALVKVLQILVQAETHLSTASVVKPANLIAVQGVYLNPIDTPPIEVKDLHAILQIPNKFVRGAQVVAYFKHTSYDELVQSIEIVWFDYALAGEISEGLRERPGDALKLAQIGLGHKNLVIQRTALKVLESVGRESAYAQETLNLLRNFLDRTTAPLSHLVTEVVARLEGRDLTHLHSKHARLAQWAKMVKSLSSRKKGERAVAAQNIANIKDPCFTEVLLRALYDEEDGKTSKALIYALVEIGGFEAIGYLTWLLKGEHVQHALAALAKFGDRSALTFLFSPAGINTPPSYYRELLPLYGDLIFHPLVAAIKAMENPGAYKAGFTNLFVALRSPTFAQTITERLERDAALAAKFAALMQRMYPKLVKKTDLKAKQNATLAPAVKQLIISTLGGERIAKIAFGGARSTAEALTPDRKYLVTLSVLNRKLEILNAQNGTLEASVQFKDFPYLTFLTPDGKYLLAAKNVTNAYTHAVEVWEFGQWEQSLASIPHPTQIYALTTTSDNKQIVIGGEKTVRVLEFGTWREVIELEGFERVYYAKTVPAKKWVLAGDWKGILRVWDETTWTKIAEVKADSWFPGRGAISADGEYLVYGGFIGIRVWETHTWAEIAALTRPKNIVCVTLTPDNKYLLVGSAKKLKFIEFGSWKNIMTLDDDDYIQSIAVHPDGKTIITRGRKGNKAWQLDLAMLET